MLICYYFLLICYFMSSMGYYSDLSYAIFQNPLCHFFTFNILEFFFLILICNFPELNTYVNFRV
jgi:hypothetical protein